jgi:hypothetical protein
MGKNAKRKEINRQNRKKILEKQASLDPSIPRLPPRVTSKEYKHQGMMDLFENPMTKAAMSALSEEDKEKYRIIGEHLYGNTNFENEQSVNSMPTSMTEAVAYLESQLNSGLHPSILEENEKSLLEDAYGKEWYKRWGYVFEDLTDIVTLVRN